MHVSADEPRSQQQTVNPGWHKEQEEAGGRAQSVIGSLAKTSRVEAINRNCARSKKALLALNLRRVLQTGSQRTGAVERIGGFPHRVQSLNEALTRLTAEQLHLRAAEASSQLVGNETSNVNVLKLNLIIIWAEVKLGADYILRSGPFYAIRKGSALKFYTRPSDILNNNNITGLCVT